ncbi:MAG: hypothetical protein Aurels2KO_48990 [Aureliella sp.]
MATNDTTALYPPLIGIDIGNSGVKLARLLPEQKRIDSISRINWDLSSDPSSGEHAGLHPTRDTWLQSVAEYLSASFGQLPSELTWVLSSVHADAGAALCNWAAEKEWPVLRPTHKTLQIEVDVQYPERVGVDRLLAAYAASLSVTRRPMVVIQAGSAVTIDLVTEAKGNGASFQGGAILPGVPMILRLLGRAADQLPELEADDLIHAPNLPGKNTQQAMLCGATGALIGGATYLLDSYRQRFGQQVPAVVSGGDGPQLLPYLPKPTIEREQLVLHGLMQFAIDHFTAQT